MTRRAPDRSALEVVQARLAAVLDQLGAYVRGEGVEDESRALLVECGRTLDGHPMPPPTNGCHACGQVLGHWRRVHFAKATDTKPCPGSWK